MRSQQLIRSCALVATVLVSVFANANAPGDQYAVFNATQMFIVDNYTSLKWDRFIAPQLVNYAVAQNTCAGNGARLPTVRELLTLVDEDPDYAWDPDSGTPKPTHIDPNAFPNLPGSIFWTMSPGTTSSTKDVKIVDFTSGRTADLPTSNSAYVRCVVDL